jgi:hypothetical protein
LITTDFCRDRVVVMVILAHWLMRRRVADRRWTWISRRAQVTVRIGDDTASIANLIDVGVARTAREPFFFIATPLRRRHLRADATIEDHGTVHAFCSNSYPFLWLTSYSSETSSSSCEHRPSLARRAEEPLRGVRS